MIPFWLVQRLTREDTGHKGFDGSFRCQYMGSAEFEFGAIPESLRRIRAGRGRGISVVEIEGRRVYVYGAADKRSEAVRSLPEWVRLGCRGQEMSYFDDHLHGRDVWQEVDAWWALDEDVIFTLTRGMADDVAEAVGS